MRGFHRYWTRIDILCPHVAEPRAHTLFENVYIHPLGAGAVLRPMHVVRQGVRVLAEHNPDLIVVHAYGFQLLTLGAMALARRTRRPLVLEVHHVEGYPKAAGFRDYAQRRVTLAVLRYAHKLAKAIRIVNRAQLGPLLRTLGVPEEKLRLLYSVYLDTKVFHPVEGVTKSHDLIFVGRLVPNKGLGMILEAFIRLQRKKSDATMLMVGKGSMEPWLKRRLAGMRGISHVPRFPTTNDLARAYTSARIVVCGSTAEGGPRVVLEGMACGLPAVATPVGLMEEVVRDGDTGFLVQSWSAQEMADKICCLLEDETLYKRCASNAAQLALQFEYEQSIERYAMAYRALVPQ